jgi:hypothetical protein
LRLITLTEAFGCSRCQHIFAITPDRLYIEQLAVSYPYRKMWFWNGYQWVLRRGKHPTGIRALGPHPQLGHCLGGWVHRRSALPKPNPVAQLVHDSRLVANAADGNGDPAAAAAPEVSEIFSSDWSPELAAPALVDPTISC